MTRHLLVQSSRSAKKKERPWVSYSGAEADEVQKNPWARNGRPNPRRTLEIDRFSALDYYPLRVIRVPPVPAPAILPTWCLEMRIPALPRDALDTADRAPPISRGKRNSNHSSKSTEARLGNEGNGGLPENNKAASNTVTRVRRNLSEATKDQWLAIRLKSSRNRPFPIRPMTKTKICIS